ncbi:MAG: hypothetical protein GY898_11045 [Proteobacteria bacterium]|nr:hypothetical protein [Pseudomonadota bacterium]
MSLVAARDPRYIPPMLAAAAASSAHEATTATAAAPPDAGEVGMTITVVLLLAGLAVWLVPLIITNAKKMHG